MTTAPKLIREQLLALAERHEQKATHLCFVCDFGPNHTDVHLHEETAQVLRSLAAEPVGAEAKLTQAGVFKGAHGLRGLAEAQDFWDRQPYTTRLYYGDGGFDYLHRGVLQEAVRLLDGIGQPDSAEGEQSRADGGLLAQLLQRPRLRWHASPNDNNIFSERIAHGIVVDPLELQALSAAPHPEQAKLPIPSHVYITDKGAIVTGIPQSGWNEESTEAHNCDTNGCGQCHVLYRLDFTDERTQPEQPAQSKRDREDENLAMACGVMPRCLRDEPEQPARDGVDDIRKKFQLWVTKRHGCSTERWADSGEYKYHDTRGWWQCWQEAITSKPPQQADGGAVAPDGYHYVYYYPFNGEEVIVTDSTGGEWNGQKPIRSMPYYYHPPKSPGVGVDEATIDLALRAWFDSAPDYPPIRTKSYRDDMRRVLAALGGEK